MQPLPGSPWTSAPSTSSLIPTPWVLFQVDGLSLPSTRRNSRLKKVQEKPSLRAMPTGYFSFSLVTLWLVHDSFGNRHSSDPLSDSCFQELCGGSCSFSLFLLQNPSLHLPHGSLIHPCGIFPTKLSHFFSRQGSAFKVQLWLIN